jgi:hypothetical protein
MKLHEGGYVEWIDEDFDPEALRTKSRVTVNIRAWHPPWLVALLVRWKIWRAK